jgi:hypothetical protein
LHEWGKDDSKVLDFSPDCSFLQVLFLIMDNIAFKKISHQIGQPALAADGVLFRRIAQKKPIIIGTAPGTESERSIEVRLLHLSSVSTEQ